MPELTPDEHAILRFEETHPGRDERTFHAVRVELGMSPARYYLRLHDLVERPEAVAAYPQTAARVMRIRMRHEGRRRARSAVRRAA